MKKSALFLSLLVLVTPSLSEQNQLFSYEAAAPVDVQTVGPLSLGPEVEGRDITFASPVAGRITAYLVTPKGRKTGKNLPGVIFLHWGQGDRSEFLSEAVLYARSGAVCLSIDAPWIRPEPWRQPGEDPGQPEKTRGMYIQTVVDLRRAVDLLVTQQNVDPKRVAFVGHSFGATWGGALAGVEKRIRTFVLMGGLPNPADYSITGAPKWDALVARLKNLAPPEVLKAYSEAIEPISSGAWVGQAPPSSVFFQFGTQDSWIPRKAAEAYFTAARNPKKIAWYNTSHEFNDPQCLRDRISWLNKEIGLDVK